MSWRASMSEGYSSRSTASLTISDSHIDMLTDDASGRQSFRCVLSDKQPPKLRRMHAAIGGSWENSTIYCLLTCYATSTLDYGNSLKGIRGVTLC